MRKNIGKNISSKCRQKLLDHAKQFATDPPKAAPKRTIQKTTEATGNLIRNEIADKITKISQNSPPNSFTKYKM